MAADMPSIANGKPGIEGEGVKEITSLANEIPSEPSTHQTDPIGVVPLKPSEVLAQGLPFSDEHQQYWWKASAAVLGDFMTKCGYGLHAQYQHLLLFHKYILPALGPRPRADQAPQRKGSLTFDENTFEPSWNVRESSTKSLVRFTVEPIGFQAGTEADPFNQEAGKRLMDQLAYEIPGIHTGWLHHFLNEFFLPHDVTKALLPRILTHETIPQCLVAFDLNHDGKAAVKVYLFPILKSILTGVPADRLVSYAIVKLDALGYSLIPGLSVFDTYLVSCPRELAPRVEMMAIDCIDTAQARVKIYSRVFRNTFNTIKDGYTLGGRLSGDIVDAGLNALEELWPLLFDLPDKDFYDIELPHQTHRSGGIVFGHEIKCDSPLPETKLYFQMRHYQDSDKKVCDALSAFFERRGMKTLAKSYENDLASLFPTHDLARSNGTHTYVSFAYTAKTGVYMTMYYSPRVFESL